MERYKDLLAQKEQLEKLIAEARKKEAAAELERVRESVAEFGFTPEDIFSRRHRNAGLPVAPKYRNPETGETWSGRGRTPHWIKDQDLERFRIKE
ncbi:H-NS histone family protein (plasmid) [Paraburkholderia strydomiana]